MAVTIKTLKFADFDTDKEISFLFGMRFIDNLLEAFGKETLEDVGNIISEKTKVSDIATILFIAHENACFFMRKNLSVESKERMLFLVDQMGLQESILFVAKGFTESISMNVDESKKKNLENP